MSKAESHWKVPLADVTLGPEEIEAVTEVLKSGWLSMGPKTEEFEHRFAVDGPGLHFLAYADAYRPCPAASGWESKVLAHRSSFTLRMLSFGLFFPRYGHSFIRANHLLLQFYPITLVEQVKLNPFSLDRGMQLHRHIRIPKIDMPGPDRSSRD